MAAVAVLAMSDANGQQQVPPPTATRPPENNERGLRPLTPEEIAPNLNFYAMDPLYDPNALAALEAALRSALIRRLRIIEVHHVAPDDQRTRWVLGLRSGRRGRLLLCGSAAAGRLILCGNRRGQDDSNQRG